MMVLIPAMYLFKWAKSPVVFPLKEKLSHRIL